MASPREVEIPVTLSLDIPKQFGKTALAEKIQEFVILAMAKAWEEGWEAGWDERSADIPGAGYQNPYTSE